MRLLRILSGKNLRTLTVKEVVIEDYEPSRAEALTTGLSEEAAAFLEKYPRPAGYLRYWRGGIASADVAALNATLEPAVAYIANSRSQRVIDALNSLPVLENFRILHPSAGSPWSKAAMWVFPIGLVIWLASLPWQRRLLRNVRKIMTLTPTINTLINHEQH